VGAEVLTDEQNGAQMRFLKDISEYIMVDHKTKVLYKDSNTVMKRVLNHVAVVWRQNLRKPN
jgi:hypothetical protein